MVLALGQGTTTSPRSSRRSPRYWNRALLVIVTLPVTPSDAAAQILQAALHRGYRAIGSNGLNVAPQVTDRLEQRRRCLLWRNTF
jgi:hypothetical protein